MNLHLSQSDGFLRVAAASPRIRVADVEGNAEVALAAVRDAAGRGVRGGKYSHHDGRIRI